ncbi:alpha/beta fold hydrolase [Herbiconiux sp. P17]|uniref:alpha/beta fold hydrolase n=1 Tax=Herbiconiux wuyangfengii TaxID=3342794 RepID=UPI0035B6DA6B
MYRRLGRVGGVPLVVLNRFRGTLDTWDPEFLDLLSAERDVILFDNVGIGYTEGVAPASMNDYADGAIEVIEAFGFESVDLLGWSLGGVVAQIVTLKRPDLVRRLVVAGSGPGTVPNLPATPQRVFEIMAKQEAPIEDVNYLFYPETEAGRKAADASNARVWPRLSSSPATVTDVSAANQLRASIDFLAKGDVYERLESVTQPVLYATGAHDVMIDPFGSYAATQVLPNATLLIYSDAGHAFLFQHAEEFVTQVRRFLDE